jgi:hypothetical protein
MFHSVSDLYVSDSTLTSVMSRSVHRHYDTPGRKASGVCISGSVNKQCLAIHILLLSLKPQYSQVTRQSLQQKEVNLPLFSHCTNQFDGGLFGFFPSSDVKQKYEYICKHSWKPQFFLRYKQVVDVHNLIYSCTCDSSFLQQCTSLT